MFLNNILYVNIPCGNYVRSTSKFSLEQRHDLISATFHRCSNVR